MREGKTPIARCADKGKDETIADIDKPGMRVIVNPGGTNERFARANVKNAEVKSTTQCHLLRRDRQGQCRPDDDGSSETLYQQKLHAGVLCAVHPEEPFDLRKRPIGCSATSR